MLLSLDTFYVGKLKGVGKVWQITGCDAASSYAWARARLGRSDGRGGARVSAGGRAARPIDAPGWRLQPRADGQRQRIQGRLRRGLRPA